MSPEHQQDTPSSRLAQEARGRLEIQRLVAEIRNLRLEPWRFVLAALAAATAVVGVFAQGWLSSIRAEKSALAVERADKERDRLESVVRDLESQLERAQGALEVGRSELETTRDELALVKPPLTEMMEVLAVLGGLVPVGSTDVPDPVRRMIAELTEEHAKRLSRHPEGAPVPFFDEHWILTKLADPSFQETFGRLLAKFRESESQRDP